MVRRVKKPNSQNKNKIQNFDNVQNSEFSFFILAVRPYFCSVRSAVFILAVRP